MKMTRLLLTNRTTRLFLYLMCANKKTDSLIWYTSAQARRVAGVTQRQLDYWDLKRLVRASIRRGRGKGTERRYSFSDLVKLTVVRELRQAGLSLQKIQKAIKVLKSRDPLCDPLIDQMLVTDGVRIHRLTNDANALEDILSKGQLAFSVVFLGKIEARVRRIVGIRQIERAAV